MTARLAPWGLADLAAATPAESAQRDRAAHAAGVPAGVLMESAGRAAAAVLDRLHPTGRVTVVAGSGHNGGDAAVVARTLHAWGREVALIAVGSSFPDPSLFRGHAVAAESRHGLEARLVWADVVVDGILGTGLSGPARGGARAAIEAVNAAGRPVLSLDLPSGLEGTTGEVAGAAVRADVTVCFGWPKVGLLFQPARDLCGRLIAVEIGFPPWADPTARLITPAWALARLPRRAPDAHKGDSGRVLVLAGHDGMAGAAALAATGARRAGAGLVRIASTEGNRAILQTLVPEATFVPWERLGPEDGDLADALLAGPGIGAGARARAALRTALTVTDAKPVLLDADALNLFAADQRALMTLCAERPVAMTPHPGEMARLIGWTAREIAADPVAAATEAAQRFGCTVLLKGQPSVVASPEDPLLVNTAGSSDTATAGMGDTLAGVIGALLAAGLGARDATATGLFFSSRAADLRGLGRSLGPRDVSGALHLAFGEAAPATSPLGLPFVVF